MGTKDWTATKLVECLSDNLPLTDEQRDDPPLAEV